MITHDVIEAVLLADRIVLMHEGRIAGIGTPHELMTNPPNPEVKALMDMPRLQAERLNALMRQGPAA
jgi:osmoprotectant transport system ATP-binding protein